DIPAFARALVDRRTMWMVAFNGKIARWNGSRARELTVARAIEHFPSRGRFVGFSDDDWWLLGDRSLHWDGHALRKVELPFTVSAHFAAKPDSIWIFGMSGQIAHWDGTSWKDEDSPSYEMLM